MGGKGGRSVPFHPPVGRSGDVPDSSHSRAPAPPAMAPAPRAEEAGAQLVSVCQSATRVGCCAMMMMDSVIVDECFHGWPYWITYIHGSFICFYLRFYFI